MARINVTLKIDQKVYRELRRIAEKEGMIVSRVVENYFKEVITEHRHRLL